MKKIYYSLACCLASEVCSPLAVAVQKKSNATGGSCSSYYVLRCLIPSHLKAPETDSLNLPIDADGYITIFDGKSTGRMAWLR